MKEKPLENIPLNFRMPRNPGSSLKIRFLHHVLRFPPFLPLICQNQKGQVCLQFLLDFFFSLGPRGDCQFIAFLSRDFRPSSPLSPPSVTAKQEEERRAVPWDLERTNGRTRESKLDRTVNKSRKRARKRGVLYSTACVYARTRGDKKVVPGIVSG